jgi:hypothetical protein
MKEATSTKAELLTRDAILMILSDDEVASVSTSETALSLPVGADYLDLEQLERGVQKAAKGAVTMGRILPRKAVHEKTWNRILEELAKLTVTAPHTH